jgi:hypothetical protein
MNDILCESVNRVSSIFMEEAQVPSVRVCSQETCGGVQ